jgi:uncharacterized phage protein (TIGR02218 family)
MSYATNEASVYSGKPVQFIHFQQGTTHWRYTTADSIANVTFNSASYAPLAISATEVQFDREQASGNIEIDVPRDNPVAALWQDGPPEATIDATIYTMHRGETDFVTAFTGRVVQITLDGSLAKLVISSRAPGLGRKVPRAHWQRLCNHALFDAGCTLVAATFEETAPVQTITTNVLTFNTSDLAQTGPYFRGGWCELADGSKRFIVDDVAIGATRTVTLQKPFAAGTVVALDTLSLFPGCGRTAAICASKFSNLDNFMGFENIQTVDPFSSPAVDD